MLLIMRTLINFTKDLWFAHSFVTISVNYRLLCHRPLFWASLLLQLKTTRIWNWTKFSIDRFRWSYTLGIELSIKVIKIYLKKAILRIFFDRRWEDKVNNWHTPANVKRLPIKLCKYCSAFSHYKAVSIL